MSATDDLIASYVKLLLFQYQKPKAQATIAIIAKQLLMDGLPQSVTTAYDPATAIGPQLDVIGKYVGLPRNIGDPTPLPFFGFVDYVGANPQNMNGLTDYTSNINSNVVFYEYGYNQAAATDLSDTAYAFMLLFKIALNSCDNTLYGIQEIIKAISNGHVRVIDNLDMTITYYVSGNLPVTPTALSAYLPKPMGVAIAAVVTSFSVGTGSGDTIITGTGDTIDVSAI